jgi:mRNA interferase MazF
VFWVDFGRPLGSEPGLVHPAVIVQSNVFNASDLDTVVVCPTTTTPYRVHDPGNVELDEGDADLSEPSIVNVSQIIAIDKIRLGEWIGSLSEEKMRRVMGGIRQVLEGEDLGL